MKILALIPARGGSQRVKDKNSLMLGTLPLVSWSINAATGVDHITDILVSTDSPAIAQIANAAGAYVPWLRPAALASDTASSVDVALHALNWYEEEKGSVDGLLLLQPTSPFRTRQSIIQSIELFEQHQRLPLVSVSNTHAHPMWAFKMEQGYLAPFMHVHGIGTRSQDLPPAYSMNGSIYLISPEDLRNQRAFIGPKTTPLIIESQPEAWDIDTEWEFSIAQLICASQVTSR
jgi:CMP-N-acetylneuraminic acid synthetase